MKFKVGGDRVYALVPIAKVGSLPHTKRETQGIPTKRTKSEQANKIKGKKGNEE